MCADSSYLFCPLELMYKAGAAIHRNLYKLNMLRKTRLDVPVIGVGNLSFGGSGKTLVVSRIAEKLMADGKKVGIVCRSYGALAGPHVLVDGVAADPAGVGDEAAGYAERFAVASGRDKTAAARRLIEAAPALDVILVDDAFQHHRLHQDLRILIWPKRGAVLRDFRSAEREAEILLVPNGERSPRADLDTVYFVKEILGILDLKSEKHILVVGGLGPETDFFEHVGRYLSGAYRTLRFADHVDYRRGDVQAKLFESSRGCGAIVTTSKDHVKLKPLALDLPPIYVVRAGIKFLTNETLFWERIEAAMAK